MADGQGPAASIGATNAGPDRRRFLGALAGGLAALGLRSIGSTPVAQAANGGPFVLGTTNDATARTRLDAQLPFDTEAFLVTTNEGTAVGAICVRQSAVAVDAYSVGDGGIGVHGFGTVGVKGEGRPQGGPATTGVQGLSSDANGIGVQGQSTGSNSSGVYGSGNIGVFGTSATGAGVCGESTTSTAVGVIAKADVAGGLALRVEGFPQFFGTSGRASVAAGKKTVSVDLAGVVPTDTVLATVQGGGTVSVRSATAHADKITVAITKASKGSVSVGYLVLRT